MRFFETLLTGAALVAAALALEINDFPSKVEPGKTYEITYSPKDNTPTTFKLRTGPDNNLDPAIATLTTTATGGSFKWAFDGKIPNGDDYALEISQGSVTNYAGTRIEIEGSDASASSSAASSSASATSSASASASTSVSASAKSSTLHTTATSASASISASASTNGTVSSATLSSRTASGTTAPTSSGTTSSGPPQGTGAASTLSSSPLALIFGAIAAMAYFH